MAITAKQVMDLRAKTGLGMMDCKKALNEADGDEDLAIEILRKKGLAKMAEKLTERTTEEGIIVEIDGRRAQDKLDGYIHPCASFAVSDLSIEMPLKR